MSIKKTTFRNILSRVFVFYLFFIKFQTTSILHFFSLPQSTFNYFQYGLKKKVPEEESMMMNNDDGGRVGRKKKTPAELAAEANADSDEDEFTSKFSSVCCCLNFF